MFNPQKQLHSDRFIPVRCLSAPKNTLTNRLANDQTQSKQPSLASVQSKRNQFTFSKSLSTRQESVFGFLNSLTSSHKITKNLQPLLINCSNIIDVPGVVDNFYYNTIDASGNEFVAVGLGHDLHMFRESDRELVSFESRKSTSLISCVRFLLSDDILMCSDEDGFIEVYDVNKVNTLRMFKRHTHRVGRLENDPVNPPIFYSGSKDYKININDLREKIGAVSSLSSHKSEICGLSIKDKYLASGSNDGNVKIWDIRSQKLLQTLTHHKAAVKALSWCPWKSNLLVSGGGRADRKLVIYDFNEKKIENTIVVSSQISDISWRNSTQELLYSYSKENKGVIIVHNYFNPACRKKKLSNHTGRIVGLRVSKMNDSMVFSLSADESLMYWNIDNVRNKLKVPDVMNSHFLLE